MRYGILLAMCLSLIVSPEAAAADPVALLLEAREVVKLVGEYLGVIESLDSKVDRLLDADLKTAVSLFEQARENPRKAGKLVDTARIYFTRAAAIESDSMDEARRHKRALALLGLWACCEATSDAPNAKLALKKIVEIPDSPSFALKTTYAAVNYPDLAIPLGPLEWIKGIRVALSKTPTKEDYRHFNRDYDLFVTLRESVMKKSQSP